MLALALSGSLGASESAALVWYRASDGCPGGPEFIGKLQGRASDARLAQAGDRIDFIVTLVAAEGETVGRLERQTQGGTVAIREVRDASCSQVADAVALSLALALGRQAEAPPQEEPPAAESSPPPTSVEPAEAEPSPPATVAPAQSAALPDPKRDVPRHESPRTVDDEPGWWAGLQGGALSGVAPDFVGRAELFFEVADALPALTKHFSLRFAALGGLGTSSTAVGSVQRWILGGRAEGCPWRLKSSSLSLAPCLAFELGASGADAEGSAAGDASPWAAPGAALRGTLTLGPGFRLEAEAGALFPLLRQDVYAGSESLYRAEIVALHAGAGFSFGPP